jgi:glycosyltransferase involved in cell wall biosynthesis
MKKMTLIPVSIVIITRNRTEDLEQCFITLEQQSVKAMDVVIVDSSDTDKTKKLVSIWQKILPVRYVYAKKRGFPFQRNTGISKAKYSWIAFTDDDCLLDKHWLAHIIKSISNNPSIAVIVGKTETYYKKNMVALVTEFNEFYWKTLARVNNRIVDLETIDNKNMILNKKFLIKHNIHYDESRAIRWLGGSEDCDLGMQIQQAGGEGVYNSKIRVFHKDPCNIVMYVKNKFIRTYAHVDFEKKWRIYRHKIPIERSMGKKLLYLNMYMDSNHLSVIQQIQLFCLLFFTFLIVKSIKIYAWF